MRRRVKSLTERDWRVIDRVFVGAILVIGLVEMFTRDEPAGVKWGSAAVVSVMAVCLLWRRTRPVEVLASIIALALAGELFFVGPPGSLAQVVILLTACYSVGAHADGRRGIIGLGIGLVGVTTLTLIFDPKDIVFPVAFFVVTPWLFGRVLRNGLLTARELAERAELAEHAREEEEQRAIMAERNRVARELHDVLAHNLSVVVVQAGAARRIVERDPERAAEVAALIELTGREALAELRHLFGPVRREDGGAPGRQPGLGDVDGLVARVQQAGLQVELQIDGEPAPLPAGVDLTAYRLVQESLTNALKHAGADSATVRLSYEPNEVVISVEDDGEGAEPQEAEPPRRRAWPRRDAGAGRPLRRAAPGRPPARRWLRRARTPPHPAACPRRRAPQRPEEDADGVSVRVLLVDDQALIRAGFRMILDAEEDIEVVGECADGTQAVDSARRLAPDVILMDIRMPEMDGIEATRRIVGAEGEGSRRVLMLTTFDLDEYVYDALRAGASGFLLKDVPAEQLVEGIRVVARGEALLAPSVTKRLIHEFARSAPSRQEAPASLEDLTPRELEVFRLIARGMSNAEIADDLVVSETTVKTHVARVLMKLELRDRVQAVVLAYESGVVLPGET